MIRLLSAAAVESNRYNATGPAPRPRRHAHVLYASAPILLATFALMYFGFFVSPAAAADLNAPVERQITVKSEILRGYSATDECTAQDSLNWAKITGCVDQSVRDEIRKNTISDPFKFGLYHSIYWQLWVSRNAMLQTMRFDPLKNSGFKSEYRHYYQEAVALEKALGLTTDDICRIDKSYGATKCQQPLQPPP